MESGTDHRQEVRVEFRCHFADVGGDDDGDGETDDPACEDLLAWADDVLTFKAGKSLQVGRAKTAGSWGQYFPGAVDDVWAFQGALSETQVEKLAASWFDVPTEVPSDE
ncbi:hypothetical protein [Streptomyces sp. NPDC051662]|uniref:hypothetical protein n=1 Tax=Streptomyces sp. NPDC051662 TaxID=3154750 RepID=UPI00344438FB